MAVNRKTPYGKFSLTNRSIVSKSSSARVVHFHYTAQYPGRPSTIQTDAERSALSSRYFNVQKNILESEISSLKISKSLDDPSGNFTINLHPSKNWKKIFSPGDWVCIYLYKNQPAEATVDTTLDSKNLVMLGNVDRVARSVQRDEDSSSDKIKLSYVISGRSFGKVLEETEIWFDPYVEQLDRLDIALRTAGLEVTGSPTTLVTKILDIFLGPGAVLSNGITSALKQWRIPIELASMFGVEKFILPEGPTFYDILNKNIHDNLPGWKERQMLNPESNGSVWDMLSRSCNQLVNELFLEDVRDDNGRAYPTIVLRPRPIQTPFFEEMFTTQPTKPTPDPLPKETTYTVIKGDTLGKIAQRYSTTVQDLMLLNPKIKNQDLIYPGDVLIVKREEVKPQQQKISDKILDSLKGAHQSLQNLALDSYIELSPVEIMYEDIGKEDHSRFNMFWLDTTNHYEHMLSQVADLVNKSGIANPMFYRDSIQRHGLKRMQSTLEFCHVTGDGALITPEINLFKAFMAQIIDQNYANHLYDTGTIECAGVLEAELGKALIVMPERQGVGIKNKVYYIQAYEHSWKFPNHWSTTFSVTHGQFVDSRNIFVDVESTERGIEDINVARAYVAKTASKRPQR